MDSPSENVLQGVRRLKPRNISHGANRGTEYMNVALKSFEPPTLKEEYEDGNCEKYKEMVDNLRHSLDSALCEKDKHELRSKALESEVQALKDANSVCRQAVLVVQTSLSHVSEDLQRQKLIVSQQTRDLQTARKDLKEKLVRDVEEKLQIEQLKAQVKKVETKSEEHREWQEKQNRLEEEKEGLQATNMALQADIVELLKQKKHDAEVINVLLDQLDERNGKEKANATEKQSRNILVLGDTDAYEIGQILERTYPISAKFEAFHHMSQLVDYAESCPPVLDKSDQILIHVGTTDITRGRTATQIIYDMEKAVGRISEQSTTPIFIATIPSIKTNVKYDIEVRRLNRYLTEIEKVTVLNIYEDTEPSLAGDGYHLINSSKERVTAILAEKMQLVTSTEHTEPNGTYATSTKSSPSIDNKSDDNLSQSGGSPEKMSLMTTKEFDENQSQSEGSPEESEQTSNRGQSPERSEHKQQRWKSEKSKNTGQRQRSPEISEHSETESACYSFKSEEPMRVTRLLIRVRMEDMSHVIGKRHQNIIKLREKYSVDITCMEEGKVLIVGDTQGAEGAARDIEKTIDIIYKFRDREPMMNAPFPRSY